MSEFVASNGVGVRVDTTNGDLEILGSGGSASDWDFVVNSAGTDALREFFLAERDAELGRWRSKEHPDCVARVHEVGGWLFTDERTGASKHYSHRNRARVGTSVLSAVAREFFAAHPEPKPWHDAKPGEAWVLMLGGAVQYSAVVSNRHKFVLRDTTDYEPAQAFDLDDKRITAGRRIWPEGDA